MFISFFPRPKWFFLSAVVWAIAAVALWYAGGRALGAHFGLPPKASDAQPIVGLSIFWSKPFLWFYLYYGTAVALFTAVWRWLSPHSWWRWSILGTALIVFVTYLDVQVSVAINTWFGPFYDLVQVALSRSAPVTLGQFYSGLATFAYLAVAGITVQVLARFFASHYVFRWRTAMNEYYAANWPKLRRIEGAAQRVQEDTMRFAATTEDLGISLINSVLTLIAFLPVLIRLSADIKELPLIGAIPHPLVTAALLWSLFGTLFLALIGVRLPGLQFRNQRVEAAYRKELVYGEDDPERAQPPTLRELFSHIRRNYFRLYFNYAYFNVGRFIYLQTDVVVPYILLGPSIVAGVITLGLLNQLINALGQVRSSFQYLVNSWTTIVELISIYKRLRAFESAIDDEPLPAIEKAPAV